MMAGRPNRPNGHAAPSKRKDGLWHCLVTVGRTPDGTPKRKRVKRRTQKECADEVDRIRRQLAAGEHVVSKAPTVSEWLDHWLETVVKPNRADNTYDAYKPIIELHLKPRIGQYRIGGTRKLLEPEHLDACYADLKASGMAPSYVLQCHAVLSRALKVAHRRGRANRNVAALVDRPTVRKRKPQSLSMEAVKKIIAAIGEDRMAARWLVALMLGLRQGEALGLRWGNVDLDAEQPMLRREKQSQRYSWKHGCDDPAACARWKHGCKPAGSCGMDSGQCPKRTVRCRTEACPPSWAHGCLDPDVCKGNPRCCPKRQSHPCRRHRGKEGCPPPCAPGCTRHAASCPKRTGGGMRLVDLKSEKSEGTLPLDPMVTQALREHRRRQREERMALGFGRPGDDDLVFVSPLGKAIDPRRDHEAWEQLLQRAGLPDAKLHAARHTAATLLVATGTDIAVVQEVLGHADIRTTRGYTDVAAELKREAVERMSRVLFGGAFDALVRPSGETQQGRR